MSIDNNDPQAVEARLLELRVDALLDPDVVGTTEYRAAHELATDIAHVAVDTERPLAFMEACLTQAIREIKTIRDKLVGGS